MHTYAACGVPMSALVIHPLLFFQLLPPVARNTTEDTSRLRIERTQTDRVTDILIYICAWRHKTSVRFPAYLPRESACQWASPLPQPSPRLPLPSSAPAPPPPYSAPAPPPPSSPSPLHPSAPSPPLDSSPSPLLPSAPSPPLPSSPSPPSSSQNCLHSPAAESRGI